MFKFIRNGVSRFVSWFIPLTTKKMVVVTAATTVTSCDIETNRDQFVKSLNERLNLAVKQDSMLFAVELGRILWRDLKQRYQTGKVERARLAEAFYEACPESLRYASREVMIHDISDAIRFAEHYA